MVCQHFLNAGLVRTNPAGQKSLLDSGGIAVLVRALNSEEEKARVKAAFLASALCIEDPSIKGKFPLNTVTISEENILANVLLIVTFKIFFKSKAFS